MQRHAVRLAAVVTQFLLLCRECAPSRITTRTAVAGVKSMWRHANQLVIARLEVSQLNTNWQ
jgi:hypothetical protein